MSLAPGTRLGIYEIVSPLGAGGMGEVYRARDTKLNRDVAIKVLPQVFASDPERVQRFDREAQTLAALNHPNIAHVHGVLEQPLALVMELVDGQDLSARIGPVGMPLGDALAIARQIAEGLEAAHERGIIHRDLKPANIKVRDDGVVKILDFGLAKAMDPASSAGTLANSPTFMTGPTQVGTILGTAAYMSPEQARGKSVDKRSDIWAFGCIFFEMLTGRRPFDGETITDILGAIVHTAPDLSLLPPPTPPSVQALIARCLEKDATRRLRDIGEARVLLGDERAMAMPVMPAGAVAARTRSGAGMVIAGAVLLVVAALAAAGGYVAKPAPELRVLKSHVAVQPDGAFIRSPVISPDGRGVVFVLRSRLWVQSLDSWEPRELAGTEGGTRPFWSPTSDWIAFFRSEQLRKVPAAGGPVVDVATLPAVQAPLNSISGVWTDEGALIISMAAGDPLYRVSSGGGELKEFFKVPESQGRDLHDISSLPGGGLVATVHRTDRLDALGVLSDGVLTIVLEASNVSAPRYSPSGHLLFARQAPNAGLWALPFSVDRRQATGEPFLIGRGTDPSLARDGTLLYRGEPEGLARQLAWFTMDGRVGATVAAPQDWTEGLALSRDGTRLLASATDGIWAYDIASGARSRVTSGRSDITPQWVGTSRQMVFVRVVGSRPDLMMKRADAGSEERVLAENARFPSVTKDGRRVVFNQRASGAAAAWQIAWIELDKPTEIHRLDGPHRGARFPVVSPDGRFVAYVSGEIGRDEIFVTSQHGDGKVQVSSGGGGWCRFSGRGDAILYRTPGGDFMSVPVTAGAELSIGRPQRLFEWGPGWLAFYELAADGTRGLTAVPVARLNTVSSFSLVQNWQLEFSGR